MLNCYDKNDDPIYNDIKWIGAQIDKLPYRIQPKVEARYSEIYRQLLVEDKKNCRRRANTWLRETVNKHKII